RCRRSGNVQIIVKTKRQMVCGDARFECCKDKDFFRSTDFENTAAAITYIKVAVMIESDAGGNTHALDEQFRMTGAIDPVDVSFESARGKQLSRQIEGQPGSIHDIRDEGRYRTLGSDFVDGYGRFLSASAAVCCVDISFGIDRGISDRMEVRSDFLPDFVWKRPAGIPVRGHHQFGGSEFGGRLRHLRDDLRA